MKITDLDLPSVKIIEPQYFEDYRGYFCESYSKRELEKYGINYNFIQDSHGYSQKKGTLRGIHFQLNPAAQAKLVRCTSGEVLDVAVDLRKNSPTYKKWTSVILSKQNRKQILIPIGFGHAYLTLCDECEVQYKVSEFYMPGLDKAIAWNDPEIGIKWNIANPILSEKDANAPKIFECDFELF